MDIDPSLLSADKIRPLSRLEYERMVQLGFFDVGERIELLEGVLVKMSPQDWQHAAIVERLGKLLGRAIDEALAIRMGLPFAAGAYSEPEPDLAVVVDDPTLREHPSKVLLLIEVANTSLEYDRTAKLAVYAKARVPEYWVIDMKTMSVEVYTKPVRGLYRRPQVLRDGDVLRPTRLPGIEIAISDLPR
ncbi:MAG TPA: Uma2 family endonuclease [Kofleriaceae bacterium]|nr:Uma2 family endonuclease [Kofleriaceae bacterium]